MKKSELKEIIREEISIALNETQASPSMLTVYLTKPAADSMKRDLKANGVKFKEITPTRFEMEETAKVRMAIKLVKERFGTRAIKVEGLSESNKPGKL